MSSSKVASFRALHESGCFVLPNPWDVGSALYLAQLGFRALATTSAGFAFSQGFADNRLSRDRVLVHMRAIADAVALPVSADFEGAFAIAPADVFTNITFGLGTGVAGLSIEDASGAPHEPLYDAALSVERVRAARSAIDASGRGVVLTARCEAYLVGAADPFRTALARLVAYADAGADCLFAPGVRDESQIAALVKAVAPRAVNVLVSAPIPGLSVTRLAELGVRRISVGSALARVAWGGFLRAAQALAEGSFDALLDAPTNSQLNSFFAGRAAE